MRDRATGRPIHTVEVQDADGQALSIRDVFVPDESLPVRKKNSA